MNSNRERKKKLLVRILALLLAVLMIGGAAYSVVYMLVISAAAEDVVNRIDVQDDVRLRVGLMYADGVTTDFETTTTNGYIVGVQPLEDQTYLFTPVGEIDTKVVTVAVDDNLGKSDGTYYVTGTAENTVVGGYHVEFATDIAINDVNTIETMCAATRSLFASSGFSVFPVYVNGVIRFRVGSFASQTEADAAYPFIAGFMNYFSSCVVEPSDTCVTLLDPSTDQILWEYECADGTSLGLQARDDGTDASYIKTPAANVYDGVFAYNRYAAAGCAGVSVTNVLTLDQYVEGVLPYEINNSWPMEAQKAFSVAARSYAAYQLQLHRHSEYHFDLCNASHCQLYRGAGRVNQNVLDAVQSTHGLIITYQGEIASTYYSSSHGGCTVSIGDIWGGTQSDYLVAHDTPWERYMEHSNGFWTVEVSPDELLSYLRDQKGYSELSGTITNVEVLEYAPGSTYVYRLRITASNGAVVELKNTDKVRLGLGAYLKSANFVVGRGQVEYTTDTVEYLDEIVVDASVQKEVLPPLSEEEVSVTDGLLPEFWNILTGNGFLSGASDSLYVLTGNGIATSESALHVVTENGISSFRSGTSGLQTEYTGIQNPRTITQYTVHTETKTAVASDSNNFIFVGKGWGHGGGLSQYGTKDLADLGYDYEAILYAYFSDVEIVHYKNLIQ